MLEFPMFQSTILRELKGSHAGARIVYISPVVIYSVQLPQNAGLSYQDIVLPLRMAIIVSFSTD